MLHLKTINGNWIKHFYRIFFNVIPSKSFRTSFRVFHVPSEPQIQHGFWAWSVILNFSTQKARVKQMAVHPRSPRTPVSVICSAFCFQLLWAYPQMELIKKWTLTACYDCKIFTVSRLCFVYSSTETVKLQINRINPFSGEHSGGLEVLYGAQSSAPGLEPSHLAQRETMKGNHRNNWVY